MRRNCGIVTGLVPYIAEHPEGVITPQIMERFGCTESRALKVVRTELETGRVVKCRTSFGARFLYFTSAADMEAAQPRIAAERQVAMADQRARHAAYQRSRAVKARPDRNRPLPKAKPSAAYGGPAMLDAPMNAAGAKVTRAPRPLGRWEVPEDFRGAFSLAGIGRDVQTGEAWNTN